MGPERMKPLLTLSSRGFRTQTALVIGSLAVALALALSLALGWLLTRQAHRDAGSQVVWPPGEAAHRLMTLL